MFSLTTSKKKARRRGRGASRPMPNAERSALERRQKRQALATHLPYHDFVDGVVPLVDGGKVACFFRLGPVAGDALTVADLNGLCAGLHKFLSGAPDNVELQFVYRQSHASEADIRVAYGERGRSGDADLDGFAEARLAHVRALARDGKLFESRYYLIASISPSPYWYKEGAAPAARWTDKLAAAFSTTGRTFRQRCRAEHEAMLEDVRRQADQIKRDLEACQVAVGRMSEEEAFTLCFEFLNPRRRGEGTRRARTEYRYAPDAPEFYDLYPEQRPLSPREQLVGSDVVHKDTHLAVDDVYVRAMRLKQLPLQAAPGMIECVTSGLRFPFVFSLNLRVPNRADELGKVRRRMRMQQSIASASVGSIKPDTTDAEVAYDQLKRLARQTIETDERALYVGATIVFEGRSLGEVEDFTNQVMTAARSMQLAEMIYDRHAAKDVWLATAPGNSKKDYWKLWTTGLAASRLLPVLGCWRGTRGKPFMVFPNRKGELVRLDPLQLPTPHFGIIGAPGSGKSVLLTDLILNHMQDPEALCYVVDSTGAESSGPSVPGVGQSAGGLQRLAGVLKGEFVLCDLSLMPNMNPLAIRPRAGEADDLEKSPDGIPFDLLASATRFVETLALEPGEEALGKEHLNLIMYVLQRVLYAHQDPEDPPIFRNFLEELGSLTSGDDPVNKAAATLFLRLLSAGSENNPIGRYLNRRDRVFDPQSRFVVFDMHGVDRYSEYKKAVMMLVTSFLDRQVIRFSNARRRKLILYDEAGRYLSGPIGAHMSHFAAVLRKRNAVLGFATQSLADLTEVNAGTRLLHNCGTLFVLKIHAGLAEFCRTFNLTRRDAELISGLSTTAFSGEMTACREAFLKVNDYRSVIQINIDDPTYYLSTSHPPEVRMLHMLTKLYGVPGRDVGHYDFYQTVAKALPHRGAASEVDLNQLEARIDAHTGAGFRAPAA